MSWKIPAPNGSFNVKQICKWKILNWHVWLSDRDQNHPVYGATESMDLFSDRTPTVENRWSDPKAMGESHAISPEIQHWIPQQKETSPTWRVRSLNSDLIPKYPSSFLVILFRIYPTMSLSFISYDSWVIPPFPCQYVPTPSLMSKLPCIWSKEGVSPWTSNR